MEHEIDSGQDAGIAAFAKGTLPVVLDHLEMAREALDHAERESHGVASQ